MNVRRALSAFRKLPELPGKGNPRSPASSVIADGCGSQASGPAPDKGSSVNPRHPAHISYRPARADDDHPADLRLRRDLLPEREERVIHENGAIVGVVDDEGQFVGDGGADHSLAHGALSERVIPRRVEGRCSGTQTMESSSRVARLHSSLRGLKASP